MKKKTIIILGMHRSGTSMVAGVIHSLGIKLGDDMLGKSPSNPYGHFEDRDFLTINKDILLEAGGNWYQPPAKEEINNQQHAFSDKIDKLIEAKNISSGDVLWGWKDPRSCLTMDLFLPYIPSPYLVVCYRSKDDIAKSLMKRNNFDIEESRLLIDLYLAQIQRILTENPDLASLELNYEDIVQDPESAVNEIVSFLELDVEGTQIEQAVSRIASKPQLDREKSAQKVKSFLRLPVVLLKKAKKVTLALLGMDN